MASGSYMSVFIKRDHKPKLKELKAMNEFPQMGDKIELFNIHSGHEGLDIFKEGSIQVNLSSYCSQSFHSIGSKHPLETPTHISNKNFLVDTYHFQCILNDDQTPIFQKHYINNTS